MDPLRLQLARVRRGAWLVVLVTLFAVVVSGLSVALAGVTYTGRATLTLGSQFRAPEQDAVLASGYADLFNSPGYQQQLRERGVVETGAQAAARTAAASPIIYIEVTSADQTTAQRVASQAADALYGDVNTSLRMDRQAKIAGLDAEIEKQRTIRDDSPRDSPQSIAAQEAMTSLQNNANELRGDITNELQMLQRDAGVSGSRPSIVMNVALGAAGGFVLGVLAALALAALRGRAASGAEIEHRFGVRVLAELHAGRSTKARQERAVRIERFANALGPQGHPRPFVVAVTSPQRTISAGLVASVLAERRAQQGERTLLLAADLRGARPTDGRRGVADLLVGPTPPAIADVVQSAGGGLWAVPAGVGTGDPFAAFTAERTRALVARAASESAVVVLSAPPLLEASEAQTICGVARRAVLVVDPRNTKLSEVGEAIELLKRSGAALLGVVVIGRQAARTPEVAGSALDAFDVGQPWPVAGPAGPPSDPNPAPVRSGPARPGPVAAEQGSSAPVEAAEHQDRPGEEPELPTIAQMIVAPMTAPANGAAAIDKKVDAAQPDDAPADRFSAALSAVSSNGSSTVRPATTTPTDEPVDPPASEDTTTRPPVLPAILPLPAGSDGPPASGAGVMSPTVEMAVVPPGPSSAKANGFVKPNRPRRG